MFDGFSKVDVHDHLRQGSLRIHMAWKTHTWWHRLFGNLECINATDSYFCYQYEYKHNNFGSLDGCMEFKEFMEKVAHRLINNTVDEMALRQLANRNYNGQATQQRPQVI